MHRESNRLRGKDIEPKFIINRKGQPEEVAALCAWLLCDWSQYITGALQVRFPTVYFPFHFFSFWPANNTRSSTAATRSEYRAFSKMMSRFNHNSKISPTCVTPPGHSNCGRIYIVP